MARTDNKPDDNNGIITETTASTSSTTGALVVSGGVGVGENLNVGGNVSVSGTLQASGALNSNGTVSLSNGTISTSSTTGALIVAGGAGIGGALNIAGDVGLGNIIYDDGDGLLPQSRLTINPVTHIFFDHSEAPATITQPLPTSNTILNDPKALLHLARQGTGGSTFGARATFALSRYEHNSFNSRSRLDIQMSHDQYDTVNIMTMRSNGNIGIGTSTPLYKLDVSGTARITGNTLVSSTTSSTSSTTGALVVSGGVGVAGNLNVAGGSSITGSISSTGVVSLSNGTISTNTSTGALVVGGGVGIGGALNVGGNIGLNTNVSALNSRLTINPLVIDSLEFDHSEAPLTITQPSITGNTILNDPKAVLHLARQGSTAQAYGARATFALSRYENNSSFSRSRLDIQMAHDQYDTVNIMTMRSNGNIGIGTSTPLYKLDVSGTARITGNTLVSSTTTSSSSITGALVVSGGVGVAGNLNVAGGSSITGAISSTGVVSLSNGTISTNTSTGALVVGGGVGIGGALNVAGNVLITGSLQATGGITGLVHSTLNGLDTDDHTQYSLLAGRTGGQTLVGGTASGNNLTLNSTSNATKGSVLIPETTASTSATTGALVVSGGVGVSGGVNFANGSSIIFPADTANQNFPTTTTRSIGTKIVLFSNVDASNVDFGFGIGPNSLWYSVGSSVRFHRFYHGTTNTMTLSGTSLEINHTTASTSTTSGALIVAGGAGIAGNLNVGGTTLLNGDKMRLTHSSGANYIQSGSATGNSAEIRFGEMFNAAYWVGLNSSQLFVSQTTASTNTTTGALRVVGGVGIGGNLYTGGLVRLTNTTASTSSTTGALTVSGGVGITGALYVADNIRVLGSASSTNVASGALVVAGGVGVSGVVNSLGLGVVGNVGVTGTINAGAVVANGNVNPLLSETYSLGTASLEWNNVFSQNAVTVSDRNKKKDINPLSVGLDFIKEAEPVSYRYKSTDSAGLGFIAQDLLVVCEKYNVKEVVSHDNGKDYGIKYQELIPILFNAVKELSARITELENA